MMSPASNVLPSYGLAGLCITVLAAALVYIYKELKASNIRIDAIQEERLQDAKETRDKITESMEQQAYLSKQIYDVLINLTNKRSK